MKKINFFVLVLICLAFIPLFDLFMPGLPLSHDGQDHVARIANFYKNLQEGILIPRWAGNLNWGYGHPVLMFLYPLPSYIASLFHFFGFTVVDSVKLVFGVTFIFSGLAMFLWIRNVWDETAGLIAGLFYMFAPYRFVDLYVRGAIGEHVAFVFPPLVLYFMLKLSKKYSFWYFVGGVIALAGFILAHNAISLMFLPVFFVYGLYLLLQSKKQRVLVLLYSALFVLGFMCSAFFWMPAFFEGKYTLRDIVTADDYASRFVPFSDFFFGEWSYGGTALLSKQVGLVHWVMIILAIIFIAKSYKKRHKRALVPVGLMVLFIFSLFIMTEYSMIIWESITLLRKFQFPWRFLSVTVFSAAALAGFVASYVPSRYRMVFILVGTALLFANMPYWQAKGYLNKPEVFYSGVYNGTTDTGESAPIWSVRFMEKRPDATIEILDGEGEITQLRRTSTLHEYRLSANTKVRIRENTLYFPGWNVFINNQPTPIEFQDPMHRGLMTFSAESGSHTIAVQFTETKLRMLSNSISAASLLILIAWGILEKKRLWQRYR